MNHVNHVFTHVCAYFTYIFSGKDMYRQNANCSHVRSGVNVHLHGMQILAKEIDETVL